MVAPFCGVEAGAQHGAVAPAPRSCLTGLGPVPARVDLATTRRDSALAAAFEVTRAGHDAIAVRSRGGGGPLSGAELEVLRDGMELEQGGAPVAEHPGEEVTLRKFTLSDADAEALAWDPRVARFPHHDSLFPKFMGSYDKFMHRRYISLLFSILYMQPMWNAKGGNTNFTFTESVSVNFFTFTCEIVVAYHGISGVEYGPGFVT